LVTPFNEHGSVDVSGLESLVDFQIANQVDYLVVMGTTAESVTLNLEEKELVKETVIRVVNGRLPLVLGIGGNDTAAVVAALHTTDLSDFTAVLSVSPYYNKPSQEGLYQHFKAVAQAASKPLVLYNVPARTGQNMAVDTILRLANDFDNIVAVKEASGDLGQALRLIQRKPAHFKVISGEDMLALPMTLAGGAGVISVIAQGLPADFSQLIRDALDGQPSKAFERYYKLMGSIDLIFEEGNPAGIKAMLAYLGICRSDVRLPLVAASPELSSKIKAFMDNYS
jgi:4-hydroxy-tetrahydrodipicolinate synthase